MSEGYRPLFDSDPQDAGLVEGIPSWMKPGLVRWLNEALSTPGGGTNFELVETFERRHRLNPFPRQAPGRTSLRQILIERAARDDEFALTLINYILWIWLDHRGLTAAIPAGMSALLTESGSVWEVTQSDDTARFRLTRRDLAGTKDAIAELPANERAADMLRSAWVKIASRDPDPSGAYDLAVKAVEAAAHPVVSPKHARATLGSMLGDLRAHPERWSFVLEDLDTVIAMAATLWTHHYRHGTEQRDDHTIEEADTAVHLALALVRFFTGNAITVR
jgi:hypothetical protein